MKNVFILIVIVFFFNNTSFSAATSNNDGDSNYKKGYSLIKQAKKLEKKEKIKKAHKKYTKALNYLIKANIEKPNEPNTLNYLGFVSRKIGNFEIAEKYYLEGLSFDPNHVGINEYLGELYVNTNRIDKAKERLKVLENCNCEEFEELSNAIKSGSSKY